MLCLAAASSAGGDVFSDAEWLRDPVFNAGEDLAEFYDHRVLRFIKIPIPAGSIEVHYKKNSGFEITVPQGVSVNADVPDGTECPVKKKR